MGWEMGAASQGYSLADPVHEMFFTGGHFGTAFMAGINFCQRGALMAGISQDPRSDPVGKCSGRLASVATSIQEYQVHQAT